MQRTPSGRIFALPIRTGDGEFIARYSTAGLCELRFPNSTNSPGTVRTEDLPEQIGKWHALTAQALALALQGKIPGRLPPLDLSAGTDFQQRVWTAMQTIASGSTRSYGELATAIGQPKAVRAVGGACGANPIPVFVPCHRVLAANRKIGGFSAGLDWKWKLLAREGVAEVRRR